MARKKTLERKVKRIEIRLTDAEYRLVIKKSSHYPSVSSLMLDAVQNFDIRRGRNRLDTMIEFSECVRKTEGDLGRIGNNINQIARELNRARKENVDIFLGSIDRLLTPVNEARDLLLKIELLVEEIATGRKSEEKQ